MPFREIQLLYPPHPATTWKPENIGALQIARYVAQYKYDDWRTLIYFLPDGRIEFYGRKKRRLPRYRPPAVMLAELRSLNLEPGQFHVLDGGLLHYKTARVKNTIVLWDILVHSNQHLLGTTYNERYSLLKRITLHPKKWIKLDGCQIALRISAHLWLAPIFKTGFKKLFETGSRLPEIEGLVLKNRSAPLQRAFRMEDNAQWIIRVRKPRLDYRF